MSNFRVGNFDYIYAFSMTYSWHKIFILVDINVP